MQESFPENVHKVNIISTEHTLTHHRNRPTASLVHSSCTTPTILSMTKPTTVTTHDEKPHKTDKQLFLKLLLLSFFTQTQFLQTLAHQVSK